MKNSIKNISKFNWKVEEKSRERIAEEESDDENDVDNNVENRQKDDVDNFPGQASSRSEVGSRTSTDIDAQAVEVTTITTNTLL